MKQKLSTYILFVYKHYIEEDFSDIKPIARILLKPAWFVRTILVCTYSVVCFPLILIHMYFEKNKEKILNYLKKF